MTTDTEISEPNQICVTFDIALLPSMLRAVKLLPAIGLASSASPAYMGAFRHVQAQMAAQSPLAHLDIVDEHAWYDMAVALKNAVSVSTRLDRDRYSQQYGTRVTIDGATFTLTPPLPKDHPAHADIEAAVRAIAPSTARWKKPNPDTTRRP